MNRAFYDFSFVNFKIFNGLAQSNVTDVISSKDITDKDIERALARWKYYTAITNESRSLAAGATARDENDDIDGDDDYDDRRFDAPSGDPLNERKIEL